MAGMGHGGACEVIEVLLTGDAAVAELPQLALPLPIGREARQGVPPHLLAGKSRLPLQHCLRQSCTSSRLLASRGACLPCDTCI